jgi:hypothetical protein|tara:strand:+ start:352 stop:495 length:144 start_codon:yes stop_codon:yes gene_type:complete
MPCALIEPSQHSLEYVLESQQRQALPLPVGEVLLGIKVPLFLFWRIF